MTQAKQSTIDALQAEIARARAKFPNSRHNVVACMEELGELAEVMLKAQDPARRFEEAIHVACVALRIAEEGDPSFEGWGGEP